MHNVLNICLDMQNMPNMHKHTYAEIYIKKYSQICKKICKYMQIYAFAP